MATAASTSAPPAEMSSEARLTRRRLAFPPAEIPFAVATWGASGAVAGELGPTLVAVLVKASSWRWVFFVNLPIGLFTGIGVAMCLPQLSSVVAHSLPPNRLGVGGGSNQAIRQFGGTLGVALTIAFIATPTSLAEALSHFDLVWWLLIVGGLLTSALSIPLMTRRTPG